VVRRVEYPGTPRSQQVMYLAVLFGVAHECAVGAPTHRSASERPEGQIETNGEQHDDGEERDRNVDQRLHGALAPDRNLHPGLAGLSGPAADRRRR
jgi:hypothetical protein